MSGPTSSSDLRAMPRPSSAHRRTKEPSFAVLLPRTVTLIGLFSVPKRHTLSGIVPNRMTKQLCRIRSAGSCGAPCAAMYAGDAQTIRRWFPRFRALKVLSVNVPKRNARSKPWPTMSTYPSDRCKSTEIAGCSVVKVEITSETTLRPRPIGALMRIGPDSVSAPWRIRVSRSSISASTSLHHSATSGLLRSGLANVWCG